MAGMTRQQEVAAAVSGVWEKFRAPTLDRVAAIEGAVRALVAGELDPERRRDAERDAHRLAGAVGTFGFPRGSELAREIETLLEGHGRLGDTGVARLRARGHSRSERRSRPRVGRAGAACFVHVAGHVKRGNAILWHRRSAAATET